VTMGNTNPASPTQPTPGKILRVFYDAGEHQFGDLYLPASPGPHPIAILIHGGYWRAQYTLSLMTGLAADLATRGIAAWNIEYRRIGNDGGGWPGTFRDVARATDYLRILAPTQHLDRQRVVSIGHSAGGHLALWLAARPRIPRDSPIAGTAIPAQDTDHSGLKVQGAISLAGVTDLELGWHLHLSNDAVAALLGGTPHEVPERYAAASPAALLPLGLPQILVHGTADDSVPLQMSQRYAQSALAAGDPITVIELTDVDHFALIDRHSDAWARTVAALHELLGQR